MKRLLNDYITCIQLTKEKNVCFECPSVVHHAMVPAHEASLNRTPL